MTDIQYYNANITLSLTASIEGYSDWVGWKIILTKLRNFKGIEVSQEIYYSTILIKRDINKLCQIVQYFWQTNGICKHEINIIK